ncbi:MAG: bidirectional [NiFe] hydrogenase diaphorase subunit [Archaeoglobaceae archaeon]|nr:bidirectional [NiFe] hydrogenase diaphorase subunit [Archaeoglobaceae archaeon]
MRIEVDGTIFDVKKGNLLEILLDLGFEIPHICYHKAVGSYGACRLCIVEIEVNGEWRVVTSCSTEVRSGMKVRTNSRRIEDLRKGIIELLAKYTSSDLVENLASRYGIAVEGERRCILCGLCVNVCSIMGAHAISFEGRGIEKRVSPPFEIETEICRGCLACVNICPTGAIRFDEKGEIVVEKLIVAHHEMLECSICGRSVISKKHAESIGMMEIICDRCKRQIAAREYAKSMKIE